MSVLFIGNHRSYFDILLTYSRCQRLTGYIAKKEMLKYPLLRDWMKRLYCLFLDRDNPKEGLKTILTAIDYVKKGVSICIFRKEPAMTARNSASFPSITALLRLREDRVRDRSHVHEQHHLHL